MGNLCCVDEDRKMSNRSITHRVVSNNPEKSDHLLTELTTQEKDSFKTEPEINQIHLPKHGPENYQSVKYLGRGTFGDVILTEDKENNLQYAMKVIDKRKIKEFNVLHCEHLRKISQNSLFISIRETFQNESKIYLVMEYMPNGDLYYYLKHKEFIFTEEVIKMLVSEIIVAIEILHQEGIIYRELKPENILVTNEGHIKLTDYGLSKMIVSEDNPIFTFVGTLEYTAPEALGGRYGKKIDIWAIGVLMFELRFSKNPFENSQFDTKEQIQTNIEKTKVEDILNGVIGLISHEFRNVLMKLLEKDPNKRISLEELKGHEFFSNIIWSDIPTRKNEPPLKSFEESDQIKFRDPNNEKEFAHRKLIDNKSLLNQESKTNLYEFRVSD